MTLYRETHSHYDLLLRQEEGGKQSLVVRYRLGAMLHTQQVVALPRGKVQFRIKGDVANYHFEYSTDGTRFHSLAQMDTRYLSSEASGGFTGTLIGLYATKAAPQSCAYADVEWFDYQGEE